jgi:benzoyl-CoA reductase subunit B
MEAAKRTNRLKSTAFVGRAVDAFYAELREAPAAGKRVAFCDGFPLPFPILRTMDITYFYGDAYSAMVAARHIEKPLQQVAEEHGYLREVCSYTRNAMGCSLFPREKATAGHPLWQMPRPDFVVVSDPGCSMLINWGDDERRRFRIPIFVIQMPHLWEESEFDDAVAETVRQLREFITFLEDLCQKRFDWERLRQIMAMVKKAVTLRTEAMELCRARPAPATFFDWAVSLGGINYLLGKPEGVEVYEKLKSEVQARVERGEGAVIDERFRLYWDGIMCWPKLGELAEKFASFGACVVAGRYTHFGFYSEPDKVDPERPLESIAINGIALHANRSLDWLIENISNLCLRYGID